MKTKFLKGLLVLLGAALLVTGCTTANQGGGSFNETQYNEGAGGPNGSVSPSNPFGLGTGTGMTPAH